MGDRLAKEIQCVDAVNQRSHLVVHPNVMYVVCGHRRYSCKSLVADIADKSTSRGYHEDNVARAASVPSGVGFLSSPRIPESFDDPRFASSGSQRKKVSSDPKMETVVNTPGLSSPCMMECCEGLLTTSGLG